MAKSKGQLQQLDRDRILAISDITTETVEVPEWGGAVTVRGLTGDERDEFEASCVQGIGRKAKVNVHNLRAKLVVRGCIKEDGSRMFTDEDAPVIGKKSGAAVNRVYAPIARLSGMTEEDLEELAGN